MNLYPEVLLPKSSSRLLKNEDVSSCALAREIAVDVYTFLAKAEYKPDDILPLVVAPQTTLREVFELSVYLYGYYKEQHIGIRADNTAFYTDWNKDMPVLKTNVIKYSQEKAYPLFLAASKIDNQKIDFNGETHTFSFSHKPTQINFWHFELWVKDNNGNRIPRNKSNAHTKYLVKSILEYIIANAIIFKESVNLFKHSEFE